MMKDMHIKYIDYFDSKNKKRIKEIYNKSFQKEEKFPFWILKESTKSDNVLFNEIIDNNKIIGIEYMIIDNDTLYLMYFAIEANKRNKGYGSFILKDHIKKYKNVILSIESVNQNNEVTRRRKNFYLRNGFYETHKFTEQNNVKYELLCSNSNYDITKDKLINIYKKMTNSKLLEYLINKKFNLYDVIFIDKTSGKN